MSLRSPTYAVVLSLLLLGGCRDREITAYRAPKDPVATLPPPAAANTDDLPRGHPPIGDAAQPAPGGDTMAAAAVPTGGDSLLWTAPAAWTAKANGPMRKGSYAVKGNGAEADLSITAFPGDTGGLLANVNRWRGQVSLPPLAEAQLGASVEHLDLGPLHADIVDLAGSANGAPTRLLGAIVPLNGETWFFKLLGPDALVAGQKPAFLEFLHTVRPR
jgi:hypothetical protein